MIKNFYLLNATMKDIVDVGKVFEYPHREEEEI